MCSVPAAHKYETRSGLSRAMFTSFLLSNQLREMYALAAILPHKMRMLQGLCCLLPGVLYVLVLFAFPLETYSI